MDADTIAEIRAAADMLTRAACVLVGMILAWIAVELRRR